MHTYQIIGLLYGLIGLITLLILGVDYARKKTLDISSLPLSSGLIWVCRILIAILFIYSGFVKANDYIGFGYKLDEYFGPDVFNMEWLQPSSVYLAWFISIFEIALAFALLLGYRMRLTMWLTLLMMIFFTFLTGYSAVTGKVTDCGCFGDALKISPNESFMKDVILMLMVLPVFFVKKWIRPVPSSRIAGIVTAVVFALSGIYAYYCHENLPVVDYRAYKIGTDLKLCTTETNEKGEIKCKDWDEIYRLGDDFELLDGNTLLIIAYNLDKAPEKAIRESIDLSTKLEGSGIRPVLMTATGKSQLEKLSSRFNFNYPVSFRDETMLKTVVRSNPGYVLLKNGVVVKKWHHNNTPEAEEIAKLLR
jgi:uncharacterized membrane protein YphA (DoxX/SURF4 family)